MISTRDVTLKAVAEFHKAFEIEIGDLPQVPWMNHGERHRLRGIAQTLEDHSKVLLTLAKRSGARAGSGRPFLRAHLILEELSELMTAMADDDIVGCLDALCDLRYVQDGTTLDLGLHHHFDEGFLEVHGTNMAKVGPDGKPFKNAAGRISKPEGWKPPDLERLFVKK